MCHMLQIEIVDEISNAGTHMTLAMQAHIKLQKKHTARVANKK